MHGTFLYLHTLLSKQVLRMLLRIILEKEHHHPVVLAVMMT